MNAPNTSQNTASHDVVSGINEDVKKNDYYVLSTDFQGTTRLALQQYIWQQALGFNVHPTIPELTPTASVADVACGTALWLTEVGRQIGPSSRLHGFDINLLQAPAREWLPVNMQLHEWNLFGDVPSSFVERFDLVHVRLITVVIKDNNPVPVMQNLCKLLKPGGYLQWDEVDVFRSFVVKARPELEAPAMDAWCRWMSSPKTESATTPTNEWKSSAMQTFQAHGFEEVERYDLTEKFMQRMDLMRYNNDQLLMLSEQYARRVYISGHEKGASLLKIVEEAAKDAERGAIMIMPPFCWVAKKASR